MSGWDIHSRSNTGATTFLQGREPKYFLGTVVRVIRNQEEFSELDESKREFRESAPTFLSNEKFINKSSYEYGSIQFRTASPIDNSDVNIAQPFDKNYISLPIPGEDILILSVGQSAYYYIPISGLIPNYKQTLEVFNANSQKEDVEQNSSNKNENYSTNKKLGLEKKSKPTGQDSTDKILLNDKKTPYTPDSTIKFLELYEGDTLLSGRKGSSIRLSQFYGVDNLKEPKSSIVIRNGQRSLTTNENKIGQTIREDINNDGSSIYLLEPGLTTEFEQTTSTEDRRATKWFEENTTSPNTTILTSDRIIFSAKADDYITFGKGNIGFRTDKQFTIDANDAIYLYSKSNITLESEGKYEIFLNSGDKGKVYIGKRTDAVVNASNDVQQMVLGNQLVSVMEKLILAILRLNFNTPAGVTTNPANPQHLGTLSTNGGGPAGFRGTEYINPQLPYGTPNNTQEFMDIINNDLKNILSGTNFVSK